MSGSHLMPETEEELEQVAEEISQVDEIEELSKSLHLMYLSFKKLGYDLASRKKRAPIRVLEALLFGEFHNIELSGKGEQNLLDLCLRVVQTKGALYNKVVENKLKEENGETNE
jgi:hypothetical protein